MSEQRIRPCRISGHGIAFYPTRQETRENSRNWRSVTTPLTREELKQVPTISDDSKFHLISWDEPPPEIRRMIDEEIAAACRVCRAIREQKLIASRRGSGPENWDVDRYQ